MGSCEPPHAFLKKADSMWSVDMFALCQSPCPCGQLRGTQVEHCVRSSRFSAWSATNPLCDHLYVPI